MKKILIISIILITITGCGKDSLKGKWEASTENQKIHQFVDGTSRGGIEKYILEIDGKGHYDLRQGNEDLANSYYKISNNKVIFYDEGRKELAKCKIDKNELDCKEKSYYSTKYTKLK